MPRIHTTLSGHSVEYPDPDAKLEKFLKRVAALVDDRKATEDDIITLVYGRDNPILDHTLFPERGAVTREVLDNPVYSVLTDLIARKHAAVAGLGAEQLGKRFTLTVAEAAAQAEVTKDAIRKAIAAKRLPSWVRDGQYFIDPKSLVALRFGTRLPFESTPIEFRAGYNANLNAFLRVKAPDGEHPRDKSDPEDDDTIPKWRRVGVLCGGNGTLRFFILEPGKEKRSLPWHGYEVAGKFDVVEKVNNKADARKAWEGFKAS